MKDLEFNKIFASLLVAGIIAMLAGFISKQVVHAEKLEKDAVPVAAEESGAESGAATVAMAEPILALIGTADTARGQSVAKACAACHTMDKGGANGVGPNLWGIVGRKKDAHEGYAYSGALEKVGSPNWTYLDLNEFLWKPKGFAPGTKMTFLGVKKPEDRAALIAYLRTLADSPAALPSDADIANEAAKLSPPLAAEEKAAEQVEDKAEKTEEAAPAGH